MSSGRDVMMESWSQEKKAKTYQKQKTQYQRMIEYRQVLVTELERIDNYIKELQQNEQ